jgi:hypothetical protein
MVFVLVVSVPGGRLGDGEGLQAQAAAGDVGQIAPLLFLGAVTDQRAHDVHLRVARAGLGARPIDLFEDHRGLGDAQPAATVLGRNQRREPSGVAQRLDEGLGILRALFDAAPILIAERGAQLTNGAAEVLKVSRPGIDVSHGRSGSGYLHTPR